MPRWSASGSRWPHECTPPVVRGSSSTTTNDRNDRAPRLWAGRPGSRASVPNLASSLLLACVGLFALPGQAQTAVPEDWSLIPSGVGPGDSFRTATVTAVFDPAAGICGRTEQVRTAILRRISGVSNCANVTDAHLAAITGRLDLSAKGITALAAGDFDGLTSLTRLYLNNNSLDTLPAGVFDELTSLTRLYLNNNSLDTLPAGVFDELTALELLWLQHNSLSTLPAGVFDGLTALTHLQLYNNSLSTLPAGVFDELTALKWLHLRNNSLSTLPAGVFDELTALTHLWLRSNGLTTLPAGVFDGLTALTTLDLFDNSLSTLPAGVFDGLTRLRSLWLDDNSLDTLPAGVFDGLTALTWLYLENNSLTTLPAGVFDGLTRLRSLWLDDNSLDTLPAGVFDGLTALTRLWLHSNSLSTLPDDVFEDLTELTTLRLEGNPGAPFAPTADALPDDGEVSVAGGDVTLDGSGSDGGPWGTNVTYGWAASGAAVTFDDAASVTPVVTIPALAEGTELTFTLTVTGRGAGDADGTAPDTDTATVTAVTAANASPSFTSPAAFSAPENQTAVGTVAASDSDGGDSVTGYAIQGGADVSKFSIAPATGVLTFASAPNFEAPADADTGNDYVVVVRATSGTGARAKTADQTITATVTDMGGEAPGIPAAPSVSSASATSLNVFWTAPSNAGPAITDYDYRHRVASPRGSWTEVTTTTITALGATIAGLAENTEYDVQVRATNDDGEGAWSQPGSGSTGEVAVAGLFPRASDMVRQGFVRVINHSAEAGEVTVAATDDGGMRAGPVVLTLAGDATAHFNSDDLEAGNADKGLPEGVGPPGEGDWRLELESELDIEVLSYIRTEDGFLTAMHDVAPVADGEHRVAISNPAVNTDQASRLRLINPTAEDAEVVVTGVDDDGASPGTEIVIDLPAGESATLTPTDLETGAGLDGALGDGAGKWRLAVASVRPIVVMSLLSSPTGHLTNLSTVPPGADDDGRHQVPLFPSASDPLGRQGFVRIVNRSADAGTVQVQAYDDSDVAYGIVTVAIGVGRTVHFNSDDLELGNADKGLAGSTGAGTGDWRLALSSDDLDDIQVLAYIRHDDGFLTSMHDVAPRVEGGSRVAIFNPGSNPDQVSSLRLVNPTAVDAEVTVTGIDDAGASPGTAVVLTVPAGDSRTLDAATLEDGGEDLDGALGDGKGKWRLMVTSEQSIVVMSLMTSATGQLTNLSTATDRDGT